jgi:transcription elongation factor Elf1
MQRNNYACGRCGQPECRPRVDLEGDWLAWTCQRCGRANRVPAEGEPTKIDWTIDMLAEWSDAKRRIKERLARERAESPLGLTRAEARRRTVRRMQKLQGFT